MVLPSFLIKNTPKKRHIDHLRALINDRGIHTVCESASCPNIGECFSRNTLTFMILGDVCTRHCRFCGVTKGTPLAPDPGEAEKIAKAAEKLNLNYVVITSVTRDDLPDGGASQFAKVIRTLSPAIAVEVLIPDFNGDERALRTVMEAKPEVLNHNIETVERLYPIIRPEANYRRSLNIIKAAKTLDPLVYRKSGFMVGLGETKEEVFSVLKDLSEAGCDIATIGQYLPPGKTHAAVERYVHPDEYQAYADFGKSFGLNVFAGPFVRSSYHAKETYAGSAKIT